MDGNNEVTIQCIGGIGKVLLGQSCLWIFLPCFFSPY